jgi:hypothetical protein
MRAILRLDFKKIIVRFVTILNYFKEIEKLEQYHPEFAQ